MSVRKKPSRASRVLATAVPGVRLVAVIDIGATAIRMEIAAIDANGVTKTIDSLSNPANLGKDAFSGGVIQRRTIEECVDILRRYRKVVDEYGITDRASISAVATSAVQEAANREQFLDRVYMATGIPVECIEDIELSRLTYLAVRDLLHRTGFPKPWDHLVVEVGGGSTEVLVIQDGRVTFSDTYRLGSRRLREALEAYHAPAHRSRAILLQDIRRTIGQLRPALPPGRVPNMIAMSGDARFAASLTVPGWDRQDLGAIAPRAWSKLTEKVFASTADQLARKHRIAYAEAETVGPALLVYDEIARAAGVRRILVPKINLRTAMEIEMATRSRWSPDFCDQIRHAARTLGRRYGCDDRHAHHVALLAVRLFRELRNDHRLGERQEFLLEIAALLHEAGNFINNRSHHKHSMYIILNSDLFGVTKEDLLLIALIARYHRRSPPQPDHPYYGALDRDRRLEVQKLAAILRVADALERSHLQRVRRLAFERDGDRLVIGISDVEDLTIERMALREKARLFEDIFGLTVHLVPGLAGKGIDLHGQ